MPSGTGGYSLAELTTVLVLILLTAALAVPSFGRYVQREKTRGALDLIAGDLAYARALAVRAGASMIVDFQTAGTYQIRSTGATAQTLKSVSLDDEYPGVVVSAPTTTAQVTFDSRGLIQDVGTGLFVAQLNSVADTLTITATGRIYRGY